MFVSKKWILFFSLIFAVAFAEAKFKFDKEKLTYSANAGLQFGTYTYINIMPTIGYNFTKELNIGVGPIFTYINNRYYNQENTSYGARIYARYFVYENLFLIGDYQTINNYWVSSVTRTWLNIPLFGAGYRRNIGEHLYLDFSVLWNFNNASTLYYPNPILRGGISYR